LLPLKPDPDAARNQAVRSLTRAAITTGLAALDRGIRPARFAQETWPQDNGVALVLRSSSGLLTRDDAPALLAISTAFLSALVPMSAGADLFNRSLNLSFGPGVGTISVPRLAIPNADFVREGEAIPVVQASPVTAATLRPCNIKVMVMATWELLSNPSAEDLLRAMLIESTAPALDRASND